MEELRYLSVIKRVLKFDRHDRKHVLWLTKQLIKSFLKMDLSGYDEAKFFLKLHLTHDSQLIEEEKD